MDKEVVKIKTVLDSNLAGALAWLGFSYNEAIMVNGESVCIFETNEQFEKAIKDLQELKNLYKGE